jgi:hypothetical protein
MTPDLKFLDQIRKQLKFKTAKNEQIYTSRIFAKSLLKYKTILRQIKANNFYMLLYKNTFFKLAFEKTIVVAMEDIF